MDTGQLFWISSGLEQWWKRDNSSSWNDKFYKLKRIIEKGPPTWHAPWRDLRNFSCALEYLLLRAVKPNGCLIRGTYSSRKPVKSAGLHCPPCALELGYVHPADHGLHLLLIPRPCPDEATINAPSTLSSRYCLQTALWSRASPAPSSRPWPSICLFTAWPCTHFWPWAPP